MNSGLDRNAAKYIEVQTEAAAHKSNCKMAIARVKWLRFRVRKRCWVEETPLLP
jgi:hypothetical protein